MNKPRAISSFVDLVLSTAKSTVKLSLKRSAIQQKYGQLTKAGSVNKHFKNN